MKHITVLLFIGLVIQLIKSDSTLSHCPKPCYGINVSPCDIDSVCEKSVSSSPKDGCEFICYPQNTTEEDKLKLSDSCKNPCSQASYSCAFDEECKYLSNYTCYNCEKVCGLANATCFVRPCDIDVKGQECAKKISSDAYCVDNYCIGCNSEWYLHGKRICDKLNDTCKICPNPCPSNYQQVVDHSTGCDVCDQCEPTCDAVMCSLYCPYGYVHKNGCPTCECNPCPPICLIYCENGNKIDPKTGCPTCQCNPSNCTTLRCPDDLNCTYGIKYDDQNCPTCSCNICPAIMCTLFCPNGYIKDEKGCPTCKCLPTCERYCPNGHAYTDAKDSSSISIIEKPCSCKCPEKLTCLEHCPNGFVKDAYGCETCECISVANDTCPDIMCALYCPYGYVLDENGCSTCKCMNITCSKPLCDSVCPFGYLVDSFGCSTCNCVPCPSVYCKRYCEYGFQIDPKTGCEICVCNEKPICDANFTKICGIDCKYGYVEDKNGCPTCVCESQEVCKCDKDLPKETYLCPDKVTYQKYTGVCARNEKNECYWIQTKCPIGIDVYVSTDLSKQDIEALIKKLKVPEIDITITKTKDANGKDVYRIWINLESLPANSDGSEKKPEDVAKETQASLSDKNAVAYLVSDSVVSTKNSGFIVFISLISLLLVILV